MNTNINKSTASTAVTQSDSTQTERLKEARSAAATIAERMEMPSALDYLRPPKGKHAGASLFKTSKTPGAIPTALFSQLKLSISEVPDVWLPAYAAYMERVRRGADLTRALLLLETSNEKTLSVVKDPIVAGVMLYLCSSGLNKSMRQVLLNLATQNPVGAWLAAEGLAHPDERETLVAAMRHESQLLYWMSLVPAFAPIVKQYAKDHFDLFAGLILAVHGSDGEFSAWLHTASLAALTNAAAASACLLLMPKSDPSERRLWLSVLQNEKAGYFAYETVRCAKEIWNDEDLERLKTLLRLYATGDRARNFCLWFHGIEPKQAVAALGESSVDELWGAELLNCLGDNADDFTFRFTLAEKLDIAGDNSATLVFRWLNERFNRIRNGAHS